MSIAVIPGIFYENDFLYFKEDTFKAFEGVLSDVTAIMFRDYLRNPSANPEARTIISDNMGDIVFSYTLHKDLEEMGVMKLLSVIQFETMSHLAEDDQNLIYDRLQYLLDNESRIRAIIPKRQNADYQNFLEALHSICVPWEAGNIDTLIKANRYLFYNPHEKDIALPTASVLRRKNSWVMCYDAIRYDRYCREHNISHEDKYAF